MEYGARPIILTWLEAVSVAEFANMSGASIPHYVLGLTTPGECAVAMLSDDIICDEIQYIVDDVDIDNEIEFDFNELFEDE